MRARLPFDILYEDRGIIVIDKPTGLLTTHTRLHGRMARERQPTAENHLNNYLRKGQLRSSLRVWLVHRLDRETSGVMMFAKSESVADWYRDNWAHVSQKTYLAKVQGELTAERGTFESYLREDPRTLKVHSVKETAGGKLSRTDWRKLASDGRTTEVEVYLKSGRKNQIRVHFSEHGHPIVGDVKYGGHPADRLYLHSLKLRILKPAGGEWMEFVAPIPTNMASAQKLI